MLVSTDLPVPLSDPVSEDAYVKMNMRFAHIRMLPIIRKVALTIAEIEKLGEKEGSEGFTFGDAAKCAFDYYTFPSACELLIDDPSHFEAIRRAMAEWDSPDKSKTVAREIVERLSALKLQRETLRLAYRRRVLSYAKKGDDVAEEFVRLTETYRAYLVDTEHKFYHTFPKYFNNLEALASYLASDDYGLIFAQFTALRKHSEKLRPEFMKNVEEAHRHFRAVLGEFKPKTIGEGVC